MLSFMLLNLYHQIFLREIVSEFIHSSMTPLLVSSGWRKKKRGRRRRSWEMGASSSGARGSYEPQHSAEQRQRDKPIERGAYLLLLQFLNF
jgi:hypothetical protein